MNPICKKLTLTFVTTTLLSACASGFHEPGIFPWVEKDVVSVSLQSEVFSINNPISSMNIALSPDVSANIDVLTERQFSINELRDRLLDSLNYHKMLNPNSSGPTLNVLVTEFSIRSHKEAVLLGQFGGHDGMEADVTVVDSNGKTLVKAHIRTVPVRECVTTRVLAVPVSGCSYKDRLGEVYSFMGKELTDVLAGKIKPSIPTR